MRKLLALFVFHGNWCAQTFPPIFGLFAIFDSNFTKIVAPPRDEYKNKQCGWKSNPSWKKHWKPRRNRATNRNAMLVRTMHPSNAQCTGLGARETEEKQTEWQTHFRTYSRRALYDLPQTLHDDRARQGHQN